MESTLFALDQPTASSTLCFPGYILSDAQYWHKLRIFFECDRLRDGHIQGVCSAQSLPLLTGLLINACILRGVTVLVYLAPDLLRHSCHNFLKRSRPRRKQ
jgi:hypothetical protein